MIKLKIWRWRDYLGLSGWVLSNHKGPHKGKRGQERQSQRCDDGSRGQREMRGVKRSCCWLSRCRQVPGTKEGRQPLEAGNVKEINCPLESPGGTSPANPL